VVVVVDVDLRRLTPPELRLRELRLAPTELWLRELWLAPSELRLLKLRLASAELLPTLEHALLHLH
jgi:hypothetical protein